MTRHLSAGVLLLSLIAFATPTSVAMTAADGTAIGPAGSASVTTSAQKKGRWKKDGDRCYFDANDSGPDQCTPPKGRYKKEGDRCVWVATEDGDNQCTPKGRWKKDGDRCYFDAKDEGPDQCTPPKPR